MASIRLLISTCSKHTPLGTQKTLGHSILNIWILNISEPPYVSKQPTQVRLQHVVSSPGQTIGYLEHADVAHRGSIGFQTRGHWMKRKASPTGKQDCEPNGSDGKKRSRDPISARSQIYARMVQTYRGAKKKITIEVSGILKIYEQVF